jgi:hypothetical protein
MHHLRARGHQSEPTVTALLTSASSLAFGWTEDKPEPIGLNASGGAVMFVALMVEFCTSFYCDCTYYKMLKMDLI